MKHWRILGLGMLLNLGWLGCQPKLTTSEQVHEQFRADVTALDSSVSQLLQAVVLKKDQAELQQLFRTSRLAYKKVEWLTDYYFPETAKNLNGPPLDEFEEEDNRVVPPEGYQVIEEYLFPVLDTTNPEALVQHVRILKANLKRLQVMNESNQLTDSHIFDAARMELFRIATLGITGFDSPAAQYSLPEARVALASIRDQLSLYSLEEKNAELARQLSDVFTRADQALHTEFNALNRLVFYTDCLNPLSALLLRAQSDLSIPLVEDSRTLQVNTPTLFDAHAFNAEHFVSSRQSVSNAEKVALGERLFHDTILSKNRQRSCASCHQPSQGFTDGLSKSASLSGGFIQRNTPTLLNVALQARLFSDSRVVYLEDQATDVINSPHEMHGSLADAVSALKRDPSYVEAFKKVFKDGVSDPSIRNAIAAYERSLVSLNSPFDQFIRGDQKALTLSEQRGFNLFAGKAKCATCHFLPLTNGTVPPFYEKAESEVLGVPAQAGWTNVTLDTDPGKYNLTKADIHQHAFKTPTVRNVALTAPYMHNGVYKTLEEVVEFYDRGGGQGLGLDVPNQTLSPDPLHLTPAEKVDLVNFMKALTDVPTPKTSTAVVSK